MKYLRIGIVQNLEYYLPEQKTGEDLERINQGYLSIYVSVNYITVKIITLLTNGDRVDNCIA